MIVLRPDEADFPGENALKAHDDDADKRIKKKYAEGEYKRCCENVGCGFC